jgi:hypothetical protein
MMETEEEPATAVNKPWHTTPSEKLSRKELHYIVEKVHDAQENDAKLAVSSPTQCHIDSKGLNYMVSLQSAKKSSTLT